MSNFIRDVGEDLKRGPRLPAAGGPRRLRRHPGGARARRRHRRRSASCSSSRSSAPGALYAFAEPGIDMLHPTSRDCVRTAFTLYGGILDAVEAAHYQVLTQRVSVPSRAASQVALPGIRRGGRPDGTPPRRVTSGRRLTRRAGPTRLRTPAPAPDGAPRCLRPARSAPHGRAAGCLVGSEQPADRLLVGDPGRRARSACPAARAPAAVPDQPGRHAQDVAAHRRAPPPGPVLHQPAYLADVEPEVLRHVRQGQPLADEVEGVGRRIGGRVARPIGRRVGRRAVRRSSLTPPVSPTGALGCEQRRERPYPLLEPRHAVTQRRPASPNVNFVSGTVTPATPSPAVTPVSRRRRSRTAIGRSPGRSSGRTL